MRSKTIAFAALGGAVAAAGVVLAVMSSHSSPAPSASAAPAKAETRVATPPVAPVGAPPAQPALPRSPSASPSAPDPGAGPGVRRYVQDDGTVVRDHRGPGAPPIHRHTHVHRPHRLVTTSVRTVMAVRDAVRPIVARCERRYVTARGDNPRLQAVVTVSIKHNRLTVDRAQVQTRGVTADGIVGCVRDAVSALALSVHDRDVSGHKLTLPFRLRGHRRGT